jgi:hypothetical protein
MLQLTNEMSRLRTGNPQGQGGGANLDHPGDADHGSAKYSHAGATSYDVEQQV